ncbi:Mpv17 / PMP22 family protein [Penicillium digitatum]|uniref:Mpv17 / PMP22 family protein n=3 Tax=Penicillium digitatum TaxID=36651 RepID=K9GQ23_PEND2|nr:Mpv17 / PMP22 family protein [Penicillium digitatum Pd1]EKV09986.1 Mpv17 / PMP22 family protein [Penicillium digitatum Pd1]EKV15236.1 Mpv17 / PMP22 family protein [Penicillium digitatum PHI26]QQK44392.1 Mpv17 / PMP22 family protein [Penicillium digitatum]
MTSPLIVTFVQATVLNAVSNILAQLIDQRNNKAPFTLNTVALLQFLGYGILIVAPNFYWQRALEARYPGVPSRSELSDAFSVQSLKSIFSPRSWLSLFSRSHQDDSLPSHKEKEKHVQRPQISGLRSFFMKFFYDQTAASIVNLVLFVIVINLLKGETLAKSWELVVLDFRPLMIARLKYRPVVSVLMYTVIPVDRRVVFASACGVIWGVYLSLYAGV